MSSRDAILQEIPLRENLVKTAVQFLKDPKVSISPAEHKEEFLKRKGLTEEEIKAAFKTLEQTYSYNGYTAINIPPVNKVQEYIVVNRVPTRFERLKDIFNIAALIGATALCVYWFYKKVLRTYKKSNVKNAVDQLDKSLQTSMKEIKESMVKLENDVKKLSEDRTVDPTIPQLVQELKQDLASLKSLLLSRKQFPSAPAAIPSWQLEGTGTSQEKPIEREDDAGSGSSTNNSDSSLEMIRDEPHKE